MECTEATVTPSAPGCSNLRDVAYISSALFLIGGGHPAIWERTRACHSGLSASRTFR